VSKEHLTGLGEISGSHGGQYEEGCFLGCLHRKVREKLIDVRSAYCLIALMIMAVSTSETSVNIYQNTRCNIPEDSRLHLMALSMYVCLSLSFPGTRQHHDRRTLAHSCNNRGRGQCRLHCYNNDLGYHCCICYTADMQHPWCGVKNAFGISVHSKQNNFPISFLIWYYH
jgi:hypothetical protein